MLRRANTPTTATLRTGALGVTVINGMIVEVLPLTELPDGTVVLDPLTPAWASITRRCLDNVPHTNWPYSPLMVRWAELLGRPTIQNYAWSKRCIQPDHTSPLDRLTTAMLGKADTTLQAYLQTVAALNNDQKVSARPVLVRVGRVRRR